MSIEVIIFYILLIDSISAVLMTCAGGGVWWSKHMGPFAKHFPLARGWTLYYLLLVLFIGWILYQNGSLTLPL